MKIKSLFSIAIVFLTGTLVGQDFKEGDILGIWFNEEKDAKVEIYKENDMVYGKVVWLEEPNEPDTGLPKLDDENQNEELQSRPVMGLLLVKEFNYEGEGLWEDGDIYDPKNGKTYSCYMRLETMDKLKVRGFIGISLLGRTTYWTRTSL